MLPFLIPPLFAALQLAGPAPTVARTVGGIPPPEGATRPVAVAGSFADYLRSLELRPPGSPVLLYDGRPKGRQDVHAAVVDLHTGNKDLQQCADAIIRLRAEHLFAKGRMEDIAFHLTNGFRVPWSRWSKGDRVRVDGNRCTWTTGGPVDATHNQLHRYLEFVFTYAGTLSLRQELVPASDRPIEAGDVFVQGGSPGHAVLVLDVACSREGETYMLLGQGYMPAQDFHVLKGPVEGTWYMVQPAGTLITPEWTFQWSDRRRWP